MPKVEKMDLDSSLKETITYESQMLHYGLYTAGYQRVFQADIPWHWHDEFELGYISGGSVVYQTSGLTAVSYTHLDVYKRQASHCNSFFFQGKVVLLRLFSPN